MKCLFYGVTTEKKNWKWKAHYDQTILWCTTNIILCARQCWFTDLSLSVAGDCSGTQPGSRRQAQSHESAQRTECGCARGSTALSQHSSPHGHQYPLPCVCTASLWARRVHQHDSDYLYHRSCFTGGEQKLNCLPSYSKPLERETLVSCEVKICPNYSTWPI